MNTVQVNVHLQADSELQQPHIFRVYVLNFLWTVTFFRGWSSGGRLFIVVQHAAMPTQQRQGIMGQCTLGQSCFSHCFHKWTEMLYAEGSANELLDIWLFSGYLHTGFHLQSCIEPQLKIIETLQMQIKFPKSSTGRQQWDKVSLSCGDLWSLTTQANLKDRVTYLKYYCATCGCFYSQLVNEMHWACPHHNLGNISTVLQKSIFAPFFCAFAILTYIELSI